MSLQRGDAVGFHGGELAVQRLARVEDQAARLAPMVARGQLSAGKAAFLAETTFAAMTARDCDGRLWVSPLVGPPGFLDAAAPSTLEVNTSLPAPDPLHGLPPGQRVGAIAIDFPTRRRLRVNGYLRAAEADRLTIDVDQAYGNCPQHIQRRQVRVAGPSAGGGTLLYAGNTLRPNDVRLIEGADTFFLGTTHPASGNDASHRGGPAGFVHVERGRVWWPDYPGNNMFNSFGNLAVDPTAALLFIDFAGGIALQLSGTATVRWGDQDGADGDTHTGRRVEFVPASVISTATPFGEAARLR